MPLNHMLRKCTGAANFINRMKLMCICDIKLFAKTEKELVTVKQAVRIYSHDIGLKLGIGKSAILIMKSGKQQLTERIEQSNKEKIRTLRENKKNKKEYLRRTRKLLKTKLYCRTLIKRINT